MRFFLLLFLIPSLLLALHQDECEKIHHQAIAEWNQSAKCIEQLNKLGPNRTETFILVLNDAIACCQRAIGHCDAIINDIAGKSQKKQNESWRREMKERCQKDKHTCSTRLGELQNVLQNTLSFERAKALYAESVKKADLAKATASHCPPRSLNNVDAVVAALNESAKLFGEASASANEALGLISSSSREGDKAILKQAAQDFQETANKYKKEADEWPGNVLAQKSALKDRIRALKEDNRLFEEKGLKRGSFEVQKQMVPILEQLSESGEREAVEELAQLKKHITLLEKEADSRRLTENTPLLSREEFTAREKQRRELFYKSGISPDLFLQSILQNAPRPFAIPLDGQLCKNDGNFSLYTDQFYRFIIQSNTPVSHLLVKIYEKGEVVHEERIGLPLKGILLWERYLTTDGMIFIPETKLKAEFGLDLRLQVVCDPSCNFSFIIAQKGSHSGYQFSISDGTATLYKCTLSAPPPWQLGTLRKPALPVATKPLSKTVSPTITSLLKEGDKQLYLAELIAFPILDQFVEELKGDPLALAGYVHNEINLVDPFLRRENGVFQAPGIHRNACMTYLEKQGSPWEQCQLLVYLLRKAGHQAVYAHGNLCSLPSAFVEKMLFTELPEQNEVLLQYPWVLFFDGKAWIPLFPWMKETQIHEGYDLYNFMPEEYASADRWILRYLKGDENIIKHIGPDGDDTAGILFVRFVEEELRKQGLSLADIGIHRTHLKRQFASWEDFPRPSIKGDAQILATLDKGTGLLAFALVEIFSHENPQKKLSHALPLATLTCSTIPLRFSTRGDSNHRLHVQMGDQAERLLDLDPTDQTIDIKVSYEVPIGSSGFHASQTLSIAKGSRAALCFHFGGSNPFITSRFYEQFSCEKEENKRLQALLAFVGGAYFEKCGRTEQALANLHKVNPSTVFAFGLAKLSPDLSHSPLTGESDLKFPQVDMFWFHAEPPSNLYPTVWHRESYTAARQFESLKTVDSSSNEHQILREIFKDPYAISTVKLLQLAHLQQQKKGLPEEGFLVFSRPSFEVAENTPEAAQCLYFSHLKDLNLRDVKAASPGEWNAIKRQLEPGNNLSDFAYAYMTPGPIFSQNGTYREMGALILHPYTQYALLSNNNLLFHGGLGSPLPRSYLTPLAIRQWQLVPNNNSYSLQASPLLPPPLPFSSGTTKWSPDVRIEHKSILNTVSDPVDTVTGAFYIDDADLALPGPFRLEIRRNYNSQNPLLGSFGCGWKLSLNPFLIKQGDKLYAAEEDGTVIAYRFNPETSRWEVFPENNPDLCNFNRRGIGSTANPFHAYIENNILYGADGSKRIFEDGLLKKWVNAKGNILTFTYRDDRLAQIESSYGDFCGFHYNHEGKISEIYAKDGRRISYTYSSQGDLVKVTLPNTATILYEYDRFHRIIRETRPHGRVLENLYDEQGRVIEQRSPMGPQQELVTAATFAYQDGVTTVTDARGGCTTYKIFQKQIYKIIDPLGHQTLQSWFIDEDTWFDPQAERVVEWNLPGGWPKSLKASTDKRGLTTYYLYDRRGNPEEMGLQGDDLTGSGEPLIAKKLTYNAQNLCIQEKTLDQRTVITYDCTFPFLPKRVEKHSGNTLLSYVDWEYNALGQIQKEDHSGAVTLWKYDARGFPLQKIQITGTDDPDVVTAYCYNHQGQCIQITTVDSIQKDNYDILGNRIQSMVYSPSGVLLSAAYIGYNLNNEPIWKQTANPQNFLYLDYHASGLPKATRQRLTPTNSIAYTLYEYDSQGNLIQEVNPLGYCTYREYDLLGRLVQETKEGLSTLFSYEPGGLVETVTSPSGAKTTRLYTANGLLKEEIYPDGTKSSAIYDFFGRPIQETKKEITWEIRYDDPHHRVILTHLETQTPEIREFDAKGSLILCTDAAGYTLEKTYDGLGRLKTETTPSGEQTAWNYRGDTIICTLPSGEKAAKRYEGGRVADSAVFDAEGNLIAHSSFRCDPELDRQETIQGEEVTTTWLNAFGLPIYTQKGDVATTYEYDLCGNCVASIDGEGRKTRQVFDALRCMTQKELPDGSLLEYAYDLDSHLIECRLPNGVSWKASYDLMGRKYLEELQAGGESSLHWEYTYEKGYLIETKDPMLRTHTYQYDSLGRIVQEDVDGWQRAYTYDLRGHLASAQQTGSYSSSWLSSWFYAPTHENSLVERSYDSDGRLIVESVFLNSQLLQQTYQKWGPSTRSLQIDRHQRDFTYQNNHLIQVSTSAIDLSYTYDLGGALINKSDPLSNRTFHYNAAGLPDNIHTRLPGGSYPESLEWDRSGKLSAYSATGRQKRFSYTSRGYLKSAEEENYEFDFGAKGTGIRTGAPDRCVPGGSLDAFGKIVTEISDKNSLATAYNAMGQVMSHNQSQFAWDPWGRLLQVTDGAFTWEASYDALGRRLQTRYTPGRSSTLTITSLYDPEAEFQEIGVQYGGKTFWKIYGPHSCDALADEIGTSVFLLHDALGHLAGVTSQQGTRYNEQFPSSYGPQTPAPSPALDLLAYAQSLTWLSKSQDPTGLIWIGERYYDPRGGRFLSLDPVGYPLCLDLYAYANGDPINYADLDGRFASAVYQKTKPVVIDAMQSYGGFLNSQQFVKGVNALSAFCATHGMTRSRSFQVGSRDIPNVGIGFANGIQNFFDDAHEHALKLSGYAQGGKIRLAYCATNTAPIDVLECVVGQAGFHLPPVQFIRDSWYSFFSANGPEAKFLQLCHSAGSIPVKNGLLSVPREIQKRIIVVCIAPAVIIPKELCFEAHNYISERDFVTHLDIEGKSKYGDQLQVLKAHPDASFWDHDFASPTFQEKIEFHISEYIKQYGGK